MQRSVVKSVIVTCMDLIDVRQAGDVAYGLLIAMCRWWYGFWYLYSCYYNSQMLYRGTEEVVPGGNNEQGLRQTLRIASSKGRW